MNSLWQTELLRYAVSQHPDGQRWPAQYANLIKQAAQRSATEDEKLQWFSEQLPESAQLHTSVQTYLHTVKIVRRLLYLAALILGLGSSFSLLSNVQSQVNLLHVTAVCALTPLLALLIWTLSWLFSIRKKSARHNQAGFVGRSFAAIMNLIARLLTAHQSDRTTQTAVLRGWQRLLADKKLSFWSLSLLTHSAWLAFSLGALLGAFIRLSLFQYDFYWGSTILPTDWLSGFLQLFFALPALLAESFSGAQLMTGFQTSTTIASERQLWGWLVLISIVVYGILPRILLTLIAMRQRHQALLQLPSAFSQPFYRQIAQQMLSHKIQNETTAHSSYPTPTTDIQRSGDGELSAQIAFELDSEPSQALTPIDLGHVRGSADYQQALKQLSEYNHPVEITAWCSLARSPDATILNRLAELQRLSGTALQVHLTESDVARHNSVDMAAREADWRERLEQHGIQHIRAVQGSESQ